MLRFLFVLGILLLTFAGVACIPFVADIYFFQESIFQIFGIFIAISFFIGGALMMASRSVIHCAFDSWGAFVLTVLLWGFIPLFSAIPFYCWDPSAGFISAWFESAAALTTTGTTILNIPLPKALFLWTCLLQWLGGVGILVMGMTLFPVLKLGGMQLLYKELADPSEKFLPRASSIASYVVRIYAFLTMFCALLTYWAGMPLYPSFCHALTTLSTGGLTLYTDLHTPSLKIITIFFMIIGALPLILFVRLWRREWGSFFKNAQLRGYFILLFFAFISIFLWLFFKESDCNILHTLFHIVSISTTTGYFEWENCSTFPMIILAMIGIIGGCMGSTAGGIKIFRIQILLSMTQLHLRHLRWPQTVFVPTYQGQKIHTEIYLAVLSFFMLYSVSVMIIACILSFLGHDFTTSFACSISSLSNTGYGLARVLGWSGEYNDFDAIGKLCLIFGMIMGRLEIITPFLLFMPSFWKK